MDEQLEREGKKGRKRKRDMYRESERKREIGTVFGRYEGTRKGREEKSENIQNFLPISFQVFFFFSYLSPE